MMEDYDEIEDLHRQYGEKMRRLRAENKRLREALREGIELLRQLQSFAYAPRVEVYLDKMKALGEGE